MKPIQTQYFIITALFGLLFFPIAGMTQGKAKNSGNITIMIPMQDGVTLATDLYFPENKDATFPIILMRTPYNKDILRDYGEYFAEKGFVSAITSYYCGIINEY